MFNGGQSNTANKTPLTHELVGLNLDMVSHNQQNSTDAWISMIFTPIQPNPGYGESNTT
jgi:hypothetical protein